MGPAMTADANKVLQAVTGRLLARIGELEIENAVLNQYIADRGEAAEREVQSAPD